MTTVIQAGSTITVTAPPPSQTSRDPGSSQNSLPSLTDISGIPLYFFAGVGILILAISFIIVAFRSRVASDFEGESLSEATRPDARYR